MIIFLDNSNLMDVTHGIIAHGCNAKGVMGSGVAKQIKTKYHAAYLAYLHDLDKLAELNLPIVGSTGFVRVTRDVVVANMITQEYYGSDGRQYVSYKAIRDTMTDVLNQSKKFELDVHIPYMVGAGLGGGDLATIKTIYEECSKAAGKNIYCHIFPKRK